MPITDDSRKQTRIYHREQTAEPKPERPYDERIGFTQPIATKRRIFDGISVAQVMAGAAAAATSMLLASKIGIAGSVIGAAVSSAVTIICSQLYRRALEASAEKLKASQLGFGGNGTGYGARNENGAGVAYDRGDAPRTSYGARIAPTSLRVRAANERKATQRKVLAVSIALAIAAVVATAGVILLGTAGQGLGTRPAPLIPAAPTTQAPSADEPGDVVADDTDVPAQDTGEDAEKGTAAQPDANEPSGGDGDETPIEDGSGEKVPGPDSGNEGDGTGAGASVDADGQPDASGTTDAA